MKILNQNQSPTPFEGDLHGKFDIDDATFQESLIARNLPIEFSKRLFLAQRDLILVEKVLDSSKLPLEHELFTYDIEPGSVTYQKLLHYRSLLHKKTGIFSFEYSKHSKSILTISPKNYLLSFYDKQNDDQIHVKSKGARVKTSTLDLENRYLEFILDYTIFKQLQTEHYQFRIADTLQTYYQSFKKTYCNSCVTKGYQIDTTIHPFGYYWLSHLRNLENIMESVLSQLPPDSLGQL